MTDLFGWVPPPGYPDSPGFKEPTTSQEAAVKIAPVAKTLRDQVLLTLRVAWPAGLTADEVAAKMGRKGVLDPTAPKRAAQDARNRAAHHEGRCRSAQQRKRDVRDRMGREAIIRGLVMSVGIFSIDDKVAALDVEINEARKGRREPGSALHRQYEILKAIAADLRARQQLPRNNALGALERELELLRKSRTALGYETMRAMELANIVVSKWPVISQALEQFGEESAE